MVLHQVLVPSAVDANKGAGAHTAAQGHGETGRPPAQWVEERLAVPVIALDQGARLLVAQGARLVTSQIE